MSNLLDQRRVAKLDPEFLQGVEAFKQALELLDQEIPDDQEPVKGDHYHQRVLQAFNQSQTICRQYEEKIADDETLVREIQEFFRKETDPWMRKSWIGDRARSKPSGFAGDYEMLIKLYEEKTPALGLGGYLDLCILDLPLARAVRARLAAAKAYLDGEIRRRGQSIRVLDIASGPCFEYRHWPIYSGETEVEVTAMDNDPLAIDFGNHKIAPKIQGNTKLRVVRYNALRTLNANATIEKFGRFDIIYSVGLFDYLSDKHLIGMFQGLRDSLCDDGMMYIAFKDTVQYDKTPYQWHLDWFFFQRTEADVLELYRQAGFDVDQIEMTRDATGIIINFISRHASGDIRRIDAATEGVRAPKTAERSRQSEASAKIVAED
jgi:extracellular factor (EF) 3-hydroxypalmitic acid methyl ester biosynthesis protein